MCSCGLMPDGKDEALAFGELAKVPGGHIHAHQTESGLRTQPRAPCSWPLSCCWNPTGDSPGRMLLCEGRPDSEPLYPRTGRATEGSTGGHGTLKEGHIQVWIFLTPVF